MKLPQQQKGKLKRIFTYYFHKRGAVLILGMIFVLGAMIGTKAYSFLAAEELELLQKFIEVEEISFVQKFYQSFLPEFIQLVLLFFCGLSALGQPCAVFLIFYRGLGLGLLGTLLTSQGENEFLRYALELLPQSLLFLMIQITASREALAFSLNFFRQLLGNNKRSLSISPRVYIIRFILLLLLTAIAALAGTAINFML